MKFLTILGSTGSIGNTTLSVVKQNLDKFSVHALVANSNVAMMTTQCLDVHPRYACMFCNDSAKILKNNLVTAGKPDIQVLSGMDYACKLVQCDDVDIVMSAMVGIAGLKPTFAALRAKKRVLLASKEILVTCGQLFMKEIDQYSVQVIPVDSEHNAIFQSLPLAFHRSLGRALLSDYNISRIVLTASGSSFYKMSREQLSLVTPEQACKHPTWSMGRKISVDSATMMNKGLEYIEARHFFRAAPHEIELLLHPQSIVHSMICYIDGAVLMHLSVPDMVLPITYAMLYPNRIKLNTYSNLNVNTFNTLSFEHLDIKNYPCLKLAIDVSDSGQAASVILNAANEVAVDAFLKKIISFTDIPDVIYRVLDEISVNNPSDIEDVLYIDQRTREQAVSIIYV